MEPLNGAPRPRLGVVLVNWRGAADSIECLESLLRSPLPLSVVVVDNASGDGSVEALQAWASGEQPFVRVAGPMRRFTDPPLPKPVELIRYTAAEADAADPSLHRLVVIESGGNLGFAGGNNVGLRYLYRDPGIAYFWLLNNDTVVEPAAAASLLARMDTTHNVGMCGTVVRYYHRPDTVQALNGSRFSNLTGQAKHIGSRQPATKAFDPGVVARDTDMVLGASLAVSRKFLGVVGLMEESYFLYYEEIDWATRAAGRFPVAFAQGATVYHKEGGSIGSSGVSGKRSSTSEYYLLRSRLRFFRRHHPWLLPVHLGIGAGQVARRFLRGQPAKAWVMARALLGLAY